MRVVVVAVDVAIVFDVALQPMHGQVEAAQAAGFVGLFHAADGQLGGWVLLVFGHKAGRLHKHTARPTGWVQNAAMVGLDDFR